MFTLEELLKEREQRLGKDHPAVQMLRDQITAEKSGKSFRELYTGGDAADPQTAVERSGLPPLPPDGRRPQGFLVRDADLLSAFEDVLKGLASKRKNQRFCASLEALASQIDESVITDVGDRVGDGLPIDYVRMYINEQGMVDILGLDEHQLKRVTEADRAEFARDRLKSLESDTDADICPGFWLVPITDGKGSLYLGFSVSGYSFSGVEWKSEGAFLSEPDFVAYVCCSLQMYFNGHLCLKEVPTSVDQISDASLLQMTWGR